jgi:SUKH-3 immunity protein
MNSQREFDLEKTKSAILAEGLPFLDSAKDFLTKYGGLHLTRYKKRQNGRSQPKKTVSIGLAHFDALRAIESVDCNWFQHYAARLDKMVTPIGCCGQDHACLMIDEDGKIYAGFDGGFGKIANSPGEAVLELSDKTVGGWEPIPEMDVNDSYIYLDIACLICGAVPGDECRYLPTVRQDESWRRPHQRRLDDAKENGENADG